MLGILVFLIYGGMPIFLSALFSILMVVCLFCGGALVFLLALFFQDLKA